MEVGGETVGLGLLDILPLNLSAVPQRRPAAGKVSSRSEPLSAPLQVFCVNWFLLSARWKVCFRLLGDPTAISSMLAVGLLGLCPPG